MIHINNARGGYRVNSVADNGELLAQSEVLKTKQAAWKNIKATKYLYGDENRNIHVQDDTLKRNPIIWVVCSGARKYKSKVTPKPRYVKTKRK